MRIVILLESAELWGGVKTVLQDADGLSARGHDVVILCKSAPPDWIPVRSEFRTVPSFDSAHVPHADVVIGTYWTTVPFAAASQRGVPVHYCQGYEGDNPECAPHRAHIEAVYALPEVQKITISPHLEQLLRRRFGVHPQRIVYAVDDATMRAGSERRPRQPIRVGLVGPYTVAWKDIRTGLRACSIAHAAGLVVHAVRASNVPRHRDEHDAPFPTEWHERVAPDAMGDVYRSLDVFVGTSRGSEEGFFMPAIEAMACGVPSVLTDIPCARDYDPLHDYALFVPPADPVAMAKAIVQVASDPSLRRRLRNAGLRVAARYTRSQHLDELETALRNALAQGRSPAVAAGVVQGAAAAAAARLPRRQGLAAPILKLLPTAVKILCNLPLECFDDRAAFTDIELVTFGPRNRMWVDGEFFPFDVEFDPSTGSIHELWRKLDGFVPDVLMLWWPDQEPLPRDLDACPARVVGVVSDYNLSLPAIAGLWPFFDVLLVDRPGVELFARLSFADVRYFCQFTFKARSHRPHPDLARDIDIGFAGNLNRAVQRARAPWIERLRALRQHGRRIEVVSGVFGREYGELLSRCRIGFNRSIRGEANLRAFEVPACGACLFMERANQEIRDFFVPGEECVLYGDDDFEELVEQVLADESRRQRIAAAGHARVQQHRMRHRLAALQQVLAERGPGRPTADPLARHLGRGVALLQTWASPRQALDELTTAHRLSPEDPRPLAAMALALLRLDPAGNAVSALRLLEACCATAPRFVPGLGALAWLHRQLGSAAADRWRQRLVTVTQDPLGFADVDGLPLPLGYCERNIEIAGELGNSVRAGHVGDGLRSAWRRLEQTASA